MLAHIKHFIKSGYRILAPLYCLLNQIQCKKGWVVVLASRFFARELVQQLNADGYKVFLFDACPEHLNWRFACRSKFVDIYDDRHIPMIVKITRSLGCNTVLMPQDDNLIPIYAAVNRQLDNHTCFSEIAVEASLSKTFMRQRLKDAGMKTPGWTIVKHPSELNGLSLPAVIKPPYGQGSRGISYVTTKAEACAAVDGIINDLGQDHCVFEEYLQGRQYDVEGIINDGEPHVHMISEECFTDFLPNFTKPSWYLLGPDLPKETESEILRETREALAACDFKSGAFHIEMKFQGDRAMTIDLANRMGSDFFKYTRLVTGIPAVLDYMKSMTTGVINARPLETIPRRPILRFYNYVDRPANAEIRKLARSLAAEGGVTLKVMGNQLELAGDEEELRSFLRRTYEMSNPHDALATEAAPANKLPLTSF